MDRMRLSEMIELNDYCDNVRLELTGWKDKLNTVVSKIDTISSGEKSTVAPYVNELHAILDELAERIEHLRTESRLYWQPQ